MKTIKLKDKGKGGLHYKGTYTGTNEGDSFIEFPVHYDFVHYDFVHYKYNKESDEWTVKVGNNKPITAKRYWEIYGEYKK